jgi:hypothetical protein
MERGLALTYKTLSGFNFENQPFGALAARNCPRKEPASHAQGLEGSRFVAWQL